MSNLLPSLQLVEIKQEEVNSEEGWLLRPSKVNKSIRPNQLRQGIRLLQQQQSKSIASDCASSGGEWQPPPSPTSIANEFKTPLLLPSAASSVPTDRLNTTNNVSSAIDILTSGVLKAPNTLDVKLAKCEPDNPKYMKRTDDSKGESRPKLRYFVCEICGKGYKRKDAMDKHIDIIHKGQRDFVCDVCGKAFGLKSNLNQHIEVVHNDLRPYPCEVCNKNFKDKKSVDRHIDAVHKELRPFLCEICGKSFAQKVAMNHHIDAVHKKLRNFVCEVCGKAFTEKKHLKCHVDAIHKALRPFACEFCSKAFARRGSLRSHIDNIHKESTDS